MKSLFLALILVLISNAALAVPAYPQKGGRTVNEKGEYGVIFKMEGSRLWVRNGDKWPVEVPYYEVFLVEGQSFGGFEHGDEVVLPQDNEHGRVLGMTVQSMMLVRRIIDNAIIKVEARRLYRTCDAYLFDDD